MKIYLKNQINKFDKHLKALKTKKVMDFNKNELVEKTSIIQIDFQGNLDELNLDFFFNYSIFPANILIYLTEWQAENREMRVGDTIVQQAFLPPIKSFSQKIIFGVRINKIIKEQYIKGFSYETLNGHVEKGISTFTIEKINNQIVFKIQTFSKPGNFLTKFFESIITVPYQTFCTQKALFNVKMQIESNCK